MIRVLPLILVVFWLSACQTRPVDQSTFEHPGQIEQWHMNGRLGYRTAADGGSASFDWRQQPRAGQINFSGPLGFGSAKLTWNSGLAQLKTAKGEWQARSPGELAWHLTGFWLPISALHYWARGLPWPGAPADSEFDDQRQLVTLRQLGWALEFDRYKPVAGVQLPHRVKASRDDNRFTLLIRDWQPLSQD